MADGLVGGGSGRGVKSAGIDSVIKALPTASKTSRGSGLTRGCFSKTVPQRTQMGVAPGGGCRTTAGPQQHSGQRKRGIAGSNDVGPALPGMEFESSTLRGCLEADFSAESSICLVSI